MRTKESLYSQFKTEYPNAQITDSIIDKTFFSGVLTCTESRQFGAGMYRKKVVKYHFVWDIEDNKYYFTEI